MLQLGLVRNAAFRKHAKTIQHPYSRFWIVPDLFMFHILVLGISTTDSVQKRKNMKKTCKNWVQHGTPCYSMCTSGGSQPIAIFHFRRSTPTPDLHLESAVPAARRKVRNLGGSAFKLRFRVTVVIWKLVWAIMGFKISKGKVLGIET